jgi:hypothetical protein
MNIGPGSNVDLILEMDPVAEKIDVRRANVYDVEGEQFTLSQTTPPIRPSDIGKDARLTRLMRRGNQLIRLGFSGQLLDIIRDYQLNASATVQALLIRKTSPLDTYNLRMHYRVRPGADWPGHIVVNDAEVSLLDISLGGALFCHGGENTFEHGRTVRLIYTDPAEKDHPIEAVVKRVWTPRDARGAGQECVAVRFLRLGKELERELGRELMELQRGALYKV